MVFSTSLNVQRKPPKKSETRIVLMAISFVEQRVCVQVRKETRHNLQRPQDAILLVKEAVIHRTEAIYVKFLSVIHFSGWH